MGIVNRNEVPLEIIGGNQEKEKKNKQLNLMRKLET